MKAEIKQDPEAYVTSLLQDENAVTVDADRVGMTFMQLAATPVTEIMFRMYRLVPSTDAMILKDRVFPQWMKEKYSCVAYEEKQTTKVDGVSPLVGETFDLVGYLTNRMRRDDRPTLVLLLRERPTDQAWYAYVLPSRALS